MDIKDGRGNVLGALQMFTAALSTGHFRPVIQVCLFTDKCGWRVIGYRDSINGAVKMIKRRHKVIALRRRIRHYLLRKGWILSPFRSL